MMNKLVWQIKDKSKIRKIIDSVGEYIEHYIEGGAISISLDRPKRNPDQNAKMWALLNDWSKQILAATKKYSAEDWKDMLSAAFEGATRYAPSLDNTGLIALGVRTSDFSKGRFSEFIEFIYAEGTKRGIEWSERAIEAYEEYAKGFNK